MKNLRLITPFGLALAGFVAAFGGAHAQVTEADVGLNATNEQTGPTTVTTTGGFFSARAFVNSSTDFTGGMLDYGGSGSPQTLGFVPADTAIQDLLLSRSCVEEPLSISVALQRDGESEIVSAHQEDLCAVC